MVFLMELCGKLNLHLLSEQIESHEAHKTETKQERVYRDRKTAGGV